METTLSPVPVRLRTAASGFVGHYYKIRCERLEKRADAHSERGDHLQAANAYKDAAKKAGSGYHTQKEAALLRRSSQSFELHANACERRGATYRDEDIEYRSAIMSLIEAAAVIDKLNDPESKEREKLLLVKTAKVLKKLPDLYGSYMDHRPPYLDRKQYNTFLALVNRFYPVDKEFRLAIDAA